MRPHRGAADQKALADELERCWATCALRCKTGNPCWRACTAVAASSSTLSVTGRQEGVDFLRWLEDRHFTFLGARDYDLQTRRQTWCN
jgi:glutamate dehydrogenase